MLRWVSRLAVALCLLVLAGLGVAVWQFAHYAAPDPDVTPDAHAQAYFIDTYVPARAAFLERGTALASRFVGTEHFAIPVSSASGVEGLYVDGLYVPAQERPRRLLVLTSAGHGLEGVTGGAVLRLFMDEFMDAELMADTGVLLLHALNPYGYVAGRRVTEQNIDLNRNASTYPALYQTQNAGYPLVDPLINPTGPADTQAWSHRLFVLRALLQISQHGMPMLRQAVKQGQYTEPQGIYYGGQALAPQLAALAPRLVAVLERYPLSMGIDLHTGYGERGRLQVFVNPPENPGVRKGLEAVFKDRSVDWGDGKNVYPVTGDIASWIGALRKSGAHLPAVLEFGTMDSQTTLGALKSLHLTVLENQGVQHGYANVAEQARIQRDFLEMVNPSSPAWRTKVIHDSRTVLRQVVSQLPQVSVQH